MQLDKFVHRILVLPVLMITNVIMEANVVQALECQEIVVQLHIEQLDIPVPKICA